MMTVEQVKKLVASGGTDAEIGAAVGRSRSAVQEFRAKHGIKAARKPGGITRREPAKSVAGEVAPAPKAKTLTVAEFLLNKRKAICPVCQLKEPVKAAVIEAKKKGERTADILEYLQVCHRVTIAPRDYQSHFTSRHDQ